MAEIVNLRMARKAKTRAQANVAAQEARALHGQTKGERKATQATITRIERTLEGARRDGEPD